MITFLFILEWDSHEVCQFFDKAVSSSSDQKMRERVSEKIEDFVEDKMNNASASDAAKFQSLADFWESEIDTVLMDSLETKEDIDIAKCVLNHIKLDTMLYNGSPCLEDVEILSHIAYQEVPENRGFVPFARYSNVIDAIVKDVPENSILKEHKVCNVHKNEQENRISVSCENGSTFECDSVVLTVSVNILKLMLSNETFFKPPMPPQKLSMIENVNLSETIKLFFKFKKPYPNENAKFIHFYPSNKSLAESNFSYAYVIDRVSNSDWWLLWVNARLVDEFKKYDTAKEFLDKLFEHFVKHYPGFPKDLEVDANNIYTHDWKNDPNVLGGYSYFKPCNVTIKEIVPELKKPVNFEPVKRANIDDENIGKCQILISGEITHEKFYSTTHAGFAVGIRDANSTAKFLLEK